MWILLICLLKNRAYFNQLKLQIFFFKYTFQSNIPTLIAHTYTILKLEFLFNVPLSFPSNLFLDTISRASLNHPKSNTTVRLLLKSMDANTTWLCIIFVPQRTHFILSACLPETLRMLIFHPALLSKICLRGDVAA